MSRKSKIPKLTNDDLANVALLKSHSQLNRVYEKLIFGLSVSEMTHILYFAVSSGNEPLVTAILETESYAKDWCNPVTGELMTSLAKTAEIRKMLINAGFPAENIQSKL